MSQIKEMVLCAKECSKKKEESLTFGEFCLYSSVLKHGHVNKSRYPLPASKLHPSMLKGIWAAPHKNDNAIYEVFLGGSCNPTTWRVDSAIPFFQSHRISCYNPQVSHWKPEMIEMESEAKESAGVMFFVVDKETRSVASMVEAAHVAGAGRKLALVVHELPSIETKPMVLGEQVGERELFELRRGRAYLRDVVERHSIPVFSTLDSALQYTLGLCGRKPSLPATTAHTAGHLQLGDHLLRVRNVFDNLDSDKTGYLSLDTASMALRVLSGQTITGSQLKPLVQTDRVDFETFCLLYMEVKHGYFAGIFSSTLSLITRLAAMIISFFGNLLLPLPQTPPRYDIYLGGCHVSPWRPNLALPLLKNKGLTAFTPTPQPCREHFLPLEASALESCRVLVFVMSAESRCLDHMILASHYVGMGCRMVLCIQYLQEGVEIDGEQLSSQAVKDYNRGRVYLSDLATRAGVPVFSDIPTALSAAISMCPKI